MSASTLRILAFCDYFRPEAGGGAERVAYEVYRRLVAQGAEIAVVTTDADGAGWAGEFHVFRVPTLDLSRVLGLQVSLTPGAFRRIAPVARRFGPNLLHANSLEFQTSLAAAEVRRRTGTPLVLTAHLAGFGQMAQPMRALGWAHQRTIGRHLLRRADRVIAVSEAVARHVRTLGAEPGRVRVVANGVDHEVFHPTQRRGSGACRIVFVGRLIANKGPDDAIRAVARLRGGTGTRVELRFVGDGPMRPDLETLVHRLGLAGSVSFVGRTADVAAQLAEADVLVRPSRTEGMPLTVLEAMASGVCVVASNVPGNAQLIRHGETGLLVRPGDAAALATALRRVVGAERDRHRMAEAALAEAKRYSWDRTAAETLEVFLQTMRAPAGVRSDRAAGMMGT